jgi:DNA polymerase I-like protein with 3'-5' exonuclease and polymerase domains
VNIKNREQFKDLLLDLAHQPVVVVDTETNGLSVFEGQRPISMSFYFPDADRSYNFAWAHGCGEFYIPAEAKKAENFHDLTWQGSGKKQVYKAYWFRQYQMNLIGDGHQDITLNGEVQDPWGNCPMPWLDELRQVWNQHVARKALVVYFNAPFDTHMMETIGFHQPRLTEDVRCAVSLVFEDWNSPSIGGNNTLKWQAAKWNIPGALDGETELRRQAEALSREVAQYVLDNWDDDMNRSYHKLKRAPYLDHVARRLDFDSKREMWCLTSDAVAPYAENDVVITWKLREVLRPQLENYNQWELYKHLSQAQNEFAVRMERNGIMIDTGRAAELIEELEPVKVEVNNWFTRELVWRWDKLTPDVQERLTDSKGNLAFTVASPKKLQTVLGIWGIDVEDTSKEALEGWLDANPEKLEQVEVVERVLHYRHAHRAATTYLGNWIASVDPNGFIHGSFNVNGTVTGRWSSSSGTLGDTGNFQNIPSRGFNVKECLVTPAGWKMIQIDYGQIELRLAAWIARCDTMIDLFNTGADMHAYTRDQANVRGVLFGDRDVWHTIEVMRAWNKIKDEPKTEEEAEKEILKYCRSVAKVLNFGLLYGGTWRMVSRLLKLEEEPSRALHAAWNKLYPEFAEANAYWKELGLSRRERPSGGGYIQYVQQPLSNRTRKFGLYPVQWDYTDKKTGERKSFNPRDKAAKDAFNFVVQGLASYIMWRSALDVCRMYGNDIFRPWAVIHDSLNFYVREDSLHILPAIIDRMTDWPTNPKLTAEAEVAADGSWQHLKAIDDMQLFITSGGKEGF